MTPTAHEGLPQSLPGFPVADQRIVRSPQPQAGNGQASELRQEVEPHRERPRGEDLPVIERLLAMPCPGLRFGPGALDEPVEVGAHDPAAEKTSSRNPFRTPETVAGRDTTSHGMADERDPFE